MLVRSGYKHTHRGHGGGSVGSSSPHPHPQPLSAPSLWSICSGRPGQVSPTSKVRWFGGAQGSAGGYWTVGQAQRDAAAQQDHPQHVAVALGKMCQTLRVGRELPPPSQHPPKKKWVWGHCKPLYSWESLLCRKQREEKGRELSEMLLSAVCF